MGGLIFSTNSHNLKIIPSKQEGQDSRLDTLILMILPLFNVKLTDERKVMDGQTDASQIYIRWCFYKESSSVWYQYCHI